MHRNKLFTLIRPATLQDIPALLVMGQRFHDASGYGRYGMPFSAEKVGELLRAHIQSDEARVVIAEADGKPVGMAGAIVTTTYMSETRLAAELYWWVEPHARGGMNGVRMKEDLEKWARANGAAVMSMSSLQMIDDSPADAIFARRGYHPMEKSWIRRL